MNEEAILDSYNLFVQNGYTKSLDEYKQLLLSNPNALNDSYGLFQQNGYKKSLDEFKTLMGVSQQKPITPTKINLPATEIKPNGVSISGTGFGFSQPAPKAPSVLTPQAQEEYIAEQEQRPLPVVETTQPSIAPTETLSVGPMGITGLQRTKDYKPAEEFKGESVSYITGDLLKTVGKGVVKFPADALETIAIGASAIDNLIAKTGLTEKTEASKLATYQAAQEYRKLIDEVIPTDKDIESGFWGQSANALGQMVPIILSGFTAGGAKAIATQAAKKGTKLESVINYGKNLASRMATPQGGLTISQVAAPSYEQAKSEGATENEALTYAIQNALVSYPIEMLPVDGLFKRLDKALVGNRGVEILKKAVIGGSEEAITEGIQNIYENVSANQIYGTTKDFLEGTGNASAVGGTVGLITNGLLTALLGRRARATTDEEKAELDKSIEETKKKVEQINSNNERFIETINTLEQSKPRSLTYGSAEYNFIESPDGNIELAQDDITKEQAEGIIKNLSNTYKKIQFSVQEIEPEDPYQPTTYKVVGTPIKAEVTVESPEVTQKRVDRIAEIETALSPESTIVIDDAEKIKLQTELETLKSEQDAVQKQTAGQVPVLTEAGVGEEVVQGEPQAKPQVVTEEGVKAEEVVEPKNKEADKDAALFARMDEEDEISLKEDYELSRLTDNVVNAQRDIARSDDPDTAIEEYNKAKKAKEDFESEINQRKENKRKELNIQTLIQDETDSSEKENYEYKDLYNQDPRLAALENAKDMLQFIESGDLEKAYIERGESAEEAKNIAKRAIEGRKKDIADLEANIKETPAVSLKTQPVQEVAVAPEVIAPEVVEEEQFVPLTIADVKVDLFKKDNAIDYEEDEKEGDNGRTYTYLSSITVEALNSDGDVIGNVTKVTDEDKAFYFTAQDLDGNEINFDGYETLGEAKKAIVNSYNKTKKKEFDREVKAKSKEKAKADAKAAKAKKPVKAEPVVTETIDDLLDLDVADQDNLDKIFNALDNADKNIGKRLRTGANDALLAIPLGTVQVVIKAIKALVKGGMLLRDAIKKVAADNNLTESQVSDVLNIAVKESSYSDLSVEGTGIKLTGNEEIKKGENTPTVTKTDGYQDDYSEEDILNAEHAPNSRVVTYASNIASGEISYTKDGEKITFKLPYVNKAAVKKIKSLKDKYKAVKGASKEAKIEKEKLKKEINKVSKQVIKDFTDVMTQNLLALYDTLTPEFVANSKDWYVGANRMANAIAQKYNMTVDQVGGIMAVLSPQNDWFNNVSVAERVINIMTKYGDTKLTKDVVDKAVKYNSKTGEPNNFATDLIELFNQYGEVSINELDKLGISQLTQSAILRAFDQGLNSPKVAMTDPQGLFIGFDKTPVRWNSEAEISKAIGIFRNGDIKNVNKNLGNGNKVRNFYNNIVDPNSKTPYLTADTHALSAALNGPISANDAGGFGLFNGSLEPAYALVKSAYIQAAKIAGIKPREMQSITWEAQRIGINDKNRTEEKKQETFDYIEKSRTNEKTSYERATELIEKNRSADPEWGKSRGIRTQKTSDEILKGAELRSKQRVGSISDLRGSTTGGLGESDTEMGGEVTGRQGIDEVLDLDVTDKDNLDKVFGFLDNADKGIGKILKGGANDALLAIPLNVVRVAIKTLKALVQGGMLLRDAIKKVAADNNISQESVKDILNIAPIQEEFNSLMNEVDKLIARQKSRGIEDSKITSNIDTFIRKRDEYLNANDAQKKIIEREARGKMGAAPKRAVSIGRVLGALKDITDISRQEKLKIISQIRQLSKDAAKDLAKEIRSMASSGKITAVQAANIIARFGKVNMLNEVSVSNFVDYMAKVFANAEYANKIDVAKSKLKNARQNIATKIGIADGLVGSLQRLFSVNPNIIPDQYLERYLELLNMFSERKAVLTLQEKSKVIKDVESILNEIAIEQSKADELADRFNNSENKVFDDNDNLDFTASIKEMVNQNEITQEEADIMRKYKSDIMPQVESQKMTEEEILEEKKKYIAALKNVGINPTGLSTQYERNLAKRLSNLIGSTRIEELMNLSLTELKNLLKVADNINNNYLPSYAYLMVKKLTAINDAKTLTSAIKKAVIAPLSGLYSRVKTFVSRSKRTAISEMIRRIPLFNVDQLFGDFKTKDIFNAVLNKVSEGESRFKTDLKRVQNILEKAEQKVAKSFNLNPDKTLMSKFKMMTYMIQLEYDSNQGSKQVNPAAEYLKATIKHIDEGKSQFGERDANMLQEILNKYAPDGKIDNEKLYKSFNEAEKSAIKDIRGVNESLRDKAEYTAAIIRGDRINPLTNYVHLNVLHEHQPNDLTSGIAFVNDYNNSMRPSTKAKSLIERTGKVSPLNFDIFASAQRGAKFVLMDFNLTEPIQTARQTIKETIANFEKEGRIPKEKREIINAIDSAFEEATENLLTNNFVSNSFGDDVADYIQKQGYRAVLAGTGRFVSELTSNIGFALIVDPKAFNTGIENKGFIMSVDAPLVMENVGSKQTNRVFPTDTLSGKLIDTNILQQASGIRGAKSKNPVANKIQQIWNLSGKKYVNIVELAADALISTPDKLMMRPMWFGSFANEFQNITGKKVNFEKIAANDESYMGQYKEAIEKAKTIADEKSVMAGSTDNAFMGILKGTTKPDQSVLTRAFNNFNNFMTRFLIFEYVTARTGINAAMGNGSLTKKQGVALLGGVTTRMVVYTLLTQMLGSGLMGLFFDDDEEETEKSFMQKLGQSFASAFTSLILGRDFGNATKMFINEGVERANEKYLDFLREGEYDPYKDAIQYSIIPPDKKGRQTDLMDFFLNMGGAFGPALKTADFITRKALEPEKKKEEAIERREKEINVRIPLEILGNAGLIPLYKDIRKAVMKDIYKDLEKAEKTLGDKKKIKAEKLQGYETESDMKRYDPQLWERTFGEDAVDYDEVQAEKALKKAKDSLERAMKDEMYNYIPKSKGGFGSAGFGEKSKSKGGFGSAKFGGN